MRSDLISKIDTEMVRAIAKWGAHDQIPDNLISAIAEEVGEVAHAFNHNEGAEKAKQEIVQAIGVLVRLYDMAGTFTKAEFPISPLKEKAHSSTG